MSTLNTSTATKTVVVIATEAQAKQIAAGGRPMIVGGSGETPRVAAVTFDLQDTRRWMHQLERELGLR